MASNQQNLSDFSKEVIPSAEDMRFGIVVAQWNEDITGRLLEGARNTLLTYNTQEQNIIVKNVPGSFELPFGAQLLLEKTSLDAVICIGSVIRGETSHFNFICHAASQGVKDVGLKFGKPVIFGVLTDDNKDQALARSGGKHGNKGVEAAVSAIKMVALTREL